MTALCTLGGDPVVDLQLFLPRVGVWHADVTVDGQAELTGKQTLTLDGVNLVGTVRRGGISSDVGAYRVVGGGGGFLKLATPKGYNGVPASIVVQDLLTGAGEQLSSTVEPSLLNTLLPSWVTVRRTTAAALADLLVALGDDVTWRMLPDGTVWFGRESWPVQSPDVLNISAIDTRLGRFRAGLANGSMVYPGTCFESAGTRVSYVAVSTRDASRLEAEVWTE